MAKQTHVAVIGGGMAGLSAAAMLSEKSIQTTLFEAGSQLGGRARSVAVEYNGQVVQLDNGQHILSGAYQKTLELLSKVGISHEQAFMRLPLMLNIKNPKGKNIFKLDASGPFLASHLVSFLRCQGLSLAERLSVIRFMLRQKRANFQIDMDESLNIFLLKQAQSPQVVKLLWEPLCLSALNTPPLKASSKVFLNVLRDTFSGEKSNSDLLLPRTDLSKILSQPIARYIREKQNQILTNHRIKAIKVGKEGYTVATKNERFEFSHVIIATSPLRLQGIVSGLPKLKNVADTTETYDYQPIATVYLQYPNNIRLPNPMIGLTGTTSQWVFDRGILCGQHGLMAVIISAEGDHQALEQEVLALNVAQELKEAFPNLKKPLWHQVIAEKRATFTCKPNLPRPANSTPYPNLFLAGDYTYADYPATIEGAVRSGVNAANYIINP